MSFCTVSRSGPLARLGSGELSVYSQMRRYEAQNEPSFAAAGRSRVRGLKPTDSSLVRGLDVRVDHNGTDGQIVTSPAVSRLWIPKRCCGVVVPCVVVICRMSARARHQ